MQKKYRKATGDATDRIPIGSWENAGKEWVMGDKLVGMRME